MESDNWFFNHQQNNVQINWKLITRLLISPSLPGCCHDKTISILRTIWIANIKKSQHKLKDDIESSNNWEEMHSIQKNVEGQLEN